jgi:hypothetical protein
MWWLTQHLGRSRTLAQFCRPIQLDLRPILDLQQPELLFAQRIA